MSKPRLRRRQPETLSSEELAAYAYHSRPDVLEAKHRYIDERLALIKAWEAGEAVGTPKPYDPPAMKS
jgi:hypothetical protein